MTFANITQLVLLRYNIELMTVLLIAMLARYFVLKEHNFKCQFSDNLISCQCEIVGFSVVENFRFDIDVN